MVDGPLGDAEPPGRDQTLGLDWFELADVAPVEVELLGDASALVELAAPWLPAVGHVLRPILAAAGLDADSPTSRALDDEDLVDQLVSAAVTAIRDGGFSIGAAPLVPRELAGVPLLTERLFGDLVDALPLARTRDGRVVCPDIPQDVMPGVQSGTRGPCAPRAGSGVPDCRQDRRFVDARERLESLRNFDRLDGAVDGHQYREALADSVALGSEVYACGGELEGAYASWNRDDHIHVGESLLDPGFTGDLAALFTGPADFRAGILLHEHVHRVDDLVLDATYGLLPMGPARCPRSERRAALLQMRYWGAGSCNQAAGGRIYARTQGGCQPRLSTSRQLLAAIDDLLGCTSTASTLLLAVAVAGAAFVGPAGFALAIVPLVGASAALFLASVLLD